MEPLPAASRLPPAPPRPPAPPTTGALPWPTPRRRPTPSADRPTGVLAFLRDVRGELRKVSWPEPSTVARHSIVVFTAVMALTAIVFAVDLASSSALDLLLPR